MWGHKDSNAAVGVYDDSETQKAPEAYDGQTDKLSTHHSKILSLTACSISPSVCDILILIFFSIMKFFHYVPPRCTY